MSEDEENFSPVKAKKRKKEEKEKDAPAPEVEETAEEPQLTYEEKLNFVTPIAHPMAPKKLTKKILKLVKKSSAEKTLAMGLKNLQKSLRRGQKGLIVIAGDVTPIEIFCHIPALAEELDIPYVYTPSKKDLAAARGGTGILLTCLIRKHESYEDLFEECIKEVKLLPIPIAGQMIHGL